MTGGRRKLCTLGIESSSHQVVIFRGTDRSNNYILGPHGSSVFPVEVKNEAGGLGPIPIIAAAASVA